MTLWSDTGPLTYALNDSPAAGSPLRRLSMAARPLTPAWQDLATEVAAEPSLTPFPANMLRERWERGHAAVLLQDETIVAYTSLVPVFSELTRQALAPALGVTVAELPQIDVYESMTGWTAPELRKRGVSLCLRQPLLERFARADCLFIGFTAGVGASPVLSRLGWVVAPWSQIAFVGSIIENSTVDCASGSPRGWHVRGLKPYDGPAIQSFEHSAHDWSAYCYFWVSNAGAARRLERLLAALAADDICGWRGLWGRVVESTLLASGWVPIVLE